MFNFTNNVQNGSKMSFCSGFNNKLTEVQKQKLYIKTLFVKPDYL